MNNSTKVYIKRLIYITLVFVWMTIVFMFSNEPADTSQNTSFSTTRTIIEMLVGDSISIEQKEQIVQDIDSIVRKLAHFTLYTIGGLLVYNFINTFNICVKKKILYSIATGVIYASTDEIHQLFIEGRSGQITDVLLDSAGAVTGVLCFLCISNIIQMIRKRNNKKSKNLI